MNRTGPESSSEGTHQDSTAWEVQFDEQIDKLQETMISVRRHLHAYPEPSGEEIETSKFIKQQLEQIGLTAGLCRSDTGNPVGVVADLTVGNPAPNFPLIAIRADMDALRIPDEKDVDYQSRNPGTAHACGHDAHSAILLGAAKAAVEVNELPTVSEQDSGLRLRFLFQPAEEQSTGARWLVNQGALDGVDAILGLHVDPERLVGEVGIRYGTLTASCDEVEIVIDGHGGHAARPHHSIDPIAASAHLITSLYEILPRSVDSRNPAIFSVGKISGGYTHNVIPERVEILGTLRTISRTDRESLKEHIVRICKGTEEIIGVTISVRFLVPLEAVNNSSQITEAFEKASRSVVGADNIQWIDRPSMGGEDFSVYLEQVPGALLRLGCASPGEKAPFLHSPVFDLDENCLAIGAKIFMRTSLLLARSLSHSDKE
jgi:amidohydrolase